MMRRDGDSFWVEDCRRVQENTSVLQRKTAEITRTIQSDTGLARTQMDAAVRVATDTETILARVREHVRVARASEASERRFMCQKLSDGVAAQTRILEDLMQVYVEKQEAEIEANEFAADEPLPPPRPQNPYDVEMAPLVTATMVENEGRVQDIQRINTDMRSLHRIYTDLAGHVARQQDTIDTIEGQMLQVSDSTSNANRQLNIAKSWHDMTWRWKMRALGVVGALFAVWFFFAFLLPMVLPH